MYSLRALCPEFRRGVDPQKNKNRFKNQKINKKKYFEIVKAQIKKKRKKYGIENVFRHCTTNCNKIKIIYIVGIFIYILINFFNF